MADADDAAGLTDARPTGKARVMIVYGATLSPFVRKVMVFAAEKGLSLELRPGGMGQGSDDFRETSPFGKMPGFRDPGADDGRDFVISDSTAIIAYLEAKHPTPAMIPAAPVARARTIWFEEFGDTIIAKTGGAMFFNRFVSPKVMKRSGNEDLAAAAERDDLPPILDYLERIVPDADGFLVGEAITLADVAVASPFVNMAHIGVTIDPARWPRAAAWLATIHARPSFAELIARDRRAIDRLG